MREKKTQTLKSLPKTKPSKPKIKQKLLVPSIFFSSYLISSFFLFTSQNFGNPVVTVSISSLLPFSPPVLTNTDLILLPQRSAGYCNQQPTPPTPILLWEHLTVGDRIFIFQDSFLPAPSQLTLLLL